MMRNFIPTSIILWIWPFIYSKIFFGVPHLATCIFLSFQLLNGPELCAVIDLAWL
jgi:hypothetical protein